MSFELSLCKNALIVGAGHGIGYAIVEKLLLDFPQINILATYRIKESATKLIHLEKEFTDRLKLFQVDPTNDSELQKLASNIQTMSKKLDLILNSVGVLHTDKVTPEKSLKAFEVESFMEVMKVNALVTPLVAKHFEKNLVKSTQSAFISISAKVGSIEDNRMGGWYSYRASKAALNMLIKNISIEFQRKKMNCLVLAIHPGTTKTSLSSPFTAHTNYILHEPCDTAANILNVINKKALSESGKFFSWNGEEITW